MSISVFDLFSIGIGPSSSHTVGPMRAAQYFTQALIDADLLPKVTRVKSELFGSLGATGKGHGSIKAVLLGLEGESPESVDIESMPQRLADMREHKTLNLAGKQQVGFDEETDLIMHRKKSLPFHPNGLCFEAFDAAGDSVLKRCYYSVGGGFIVDQDAAGSAHIIENPTVVSYPFTSGEMLLEICEANNMNISDVMMANECVTRTEAEVREGLLSIWQVMQDCVVAGCKNDGILPGGLKVKRRAAALYKQLQDRRERVMIDPLAATDWVTLYALAVNEENAAGGRVVTAPTNGAAGIIPAVLHYYTRFHMDHNNPGWSDDKVVRFLLTAGAIGILFKINASISGAEVGCQGEVGSACSMAAGALTEVLGGTPAQVENAAEIGMEHNLGLTCDPIGGLVQVPCIERNAMASMKAITASRMALRGDGTHFVSLDKVIKTMRDTGRDMRNKYKETARGGLAINVLELPVNITEC
ncbi:L-serine ammonia-lyase [Leucothrix mucor]|uniref:L-serine ammonia-lyase n=1 Tax=Leucothrix mucor TaxID=45248 RepID=UPI0003B6BB4C|nr:L-serine ammonia-lyase [Leucothrix mucor]